MNLPLNYNKLSLWSTRDDSPVSVNCYIEKILKKNNVRTVLDFACGTGAQVFWLTKNGFEVTGVDISPGMLRSAKKIAQKEGVRTKLLSGDMRTTKIGTFDAIIAIFNAVGHLTKKGFEKAMRNASSNLSEGGLYLFDIFNLDCKKNDVMTMDETRNFDGTEIRKIQICELNRKSGILLCNDEFLVQKGLAKPKKYKGKFSLQIYSAKELKEMLNRNGFEVLGQYGIDESKFSDKKTARIMTIAKKNNAKQLSTS